MTERTLSVHAFDAGNRPHLRSEALTGPVPDGNRGAVDLVGGSPAPSTDAGHLVAR